MSDISANFTVKVLPIPAPPPPPPPPSGSKNFVTSFSNLGSLINHIPGDGMAITVGPSPITVTAVGRLVSAGNSLSHVIRIWDANNNVMPGGVVTVNTASQPVGQFVYASLPAPIILQAGTSYSFMSEESVGVDSFHDSQTLVTTTADAVLNGAVFTGTPGRPPTGYVDFRPNHPLGPLDFKYFVGTPPGQPVTLQGSPFFVSYSYHDFQSTVSGTGSGTVVFTGEWGSGGVPPGSVTYQWTLNGVAVSPVLTVDSGTGIDHLNWSFDTTTKPNGTYIIYPRFIDASAIAVGALISFPNVFIIGNGAGAFSKGAQTVPVAIIGTKFRASPRPDFINYDGVPYPIHTTYPMPYTHIPGANDPSSPYHSNPEALRNPANLYAEIQPGPRQTEYNGSPQYLTTPAGGVFVGYFDPGSYNNTFNAYPDIVRGNVWSGTRLNATVTPFSNFVEDPTTSGQWYGVAITGQVFKIDRHGNTTTIVGPERDKSVLSLYIDHSIPEDQVTRIIVGTHPVGLEDMGGGNDLCFDPRDPNILYVAAQLDHWIGVVNISAKSVSLYAGMPLDATPAGYIDSPNPLSAKFNNPASLIMASDGTMYVADLENSAIRKIAPGGTIGVAGAVTTLCGGTVGPTPVDRNTFLAWLGPHSVSFITWNSTTQSGAVIMATPIPNLQVGWTLTLSGVTLASGSGNPNVNYIVSALTDTSHFTIALEQSPIVHPINGTFNPGGTATSYSADFYSRPGTVTFTGGQGYVEFPNVIRFASNGNIVVGETGSNCIREIRLSGASAGTIRRIGCPDNSLQSDPIGWIWLDVDSAGTCGPVDDIVVAKWETFLSSAHWNNRMSFAQGSIPGQPAYGAIFASDNGTDGIPASYAPLNSIHYGFGHYPWAFSFSRKEGRMIGTGFASWHPTMARIAQPSDPVVDRGPNQVNISTGTYYAGISIMLSGTVPGFPMFDARPSLRSMWGEGNTFIGNRVGAPNTFEDMMVLYPNDASLAAFIHAGMGGAVPRPEITGNALRDLIYYLRRGTMQGSLGPTPVQPGANDPDTVPPVILTLFAVRNSPTSITVTWTTHKSTIGLAAGGSATQAITYGYYPCFSAIESGYGTSHSATIAVPSGVTPVHYTAIAKDMAGNIVYTADATII